MECEQFKSLHQDYANRGPVNNAYSAEHGAWNGHQQTCTDCATWAREQYCLLNGIVPSQHCCLDMAYAISKPIRIVHQGTNRVIDWAVAVDEYWIPISHDGYSATKIAYCPWCGAKLPESKGSLRLKTLYDLGFDDPGEQDTPEKFNSDRWWRETV